MSREVSSGYYIQINFSNITATLYQSIKPRASTQRVTSIQFTSQLESGPRASLRDARTVYFRGRRVDDVTTHPVISVAVNHAAIDYRLMDAHTDPPGTTERYHS